jgi:hypothetical protein
MATMRNGLNTWLKQDCANIADKLLNHANIVDVTRDVAVDYWHNNNLKGAYPAVTAQMPIIIESIKASIDKADLDDIKEIYSTIPLMLHDKGDIAKINDNLMKIAAIIEKCAIEKSVECQCGTGTATVTTPTNISYIDIRNKINELGGKYDAANNQAIFKFPGYSGGYAIVHPQKVEEFAVWIRHKGATNIQFNPFTKSSSWEVPGIAVIFDLMPIPINNDTSKTLLYPGLKVKVSKGSGLLSGSIGTIIERYIDGGYNNEWKIGFDNGRTEVLPDYGFESIE